MDLVLDFFEADADVCVHIFALGLGAKDMPVCTYGDFHAFVLSDARANHCTNNIFAIILVQPFNLFVDDVFKSFADDIVLRVYNRFHIKVLHTDLNMQNHFVYNLVMRELSEYNAKRDFGLSKEPQGLKSKKKDTAESKRKLRFVIQYHESRAKHYDLRLEHGGVLLSWAVPKGLSEKPNEYRLAVHVEDHPIEYRNFEGTIPQGEYGGGTVTIWDKGFFEYLCDMPKGLESGNIRFHLHGQKLNGVWSLVRKKGDAKTWFVVASQTEE